MQPSYSLLQTPVIYVHMIYIIKIYLGHNHHKNLLSELGNCESPVLLSRPGDQRGKTGHEEVEPWDHYNDDHGDVDHHHHDDYRDD